jgi:hypothetical protein
LFNDINIIRKSSGGEGVITKVPLAYGPKQKFLSRIDEQASLTDNKIAIKLPRMSFEITSLEYDSASKGNKFNQILVSQADGSRESVDFVPYNIGMQLNIIVKNQDEGLQILEQILPTFTPNYNVSAKMLQESDMSIDIPVTLNSVSIQDDYEGDFESRRVLIYTLDFSLKTRFFNKIGSKPVIKISQARIYEDLDKSLENVISKVDPFEATEDDDFSVVTAFNYINPEENVTLTITTSSNNFSVGEYLVGDITGTGGRIVSLQQGDDTLLIQVDNLDGLYQVGETITGLTSKEQATIQSYTVS